MESSRAAHGMVAAMLADGLARMQRAEALGEIDPEESVHQIRVACRRARSQLKTFDPLVKSGWSKELRGELRWLAKLYGPSRDLAVTRATVVEAADRTPDVDAAALANIDGRIVEELASADAAVQAELDVDRRAQLLKIWADAAREPRMSTIGKAGSVDVVVALVQGEWDALSARVAVLTPDSTIEDFHQIRILAKKVRYAAAAVRPILDEPVQAWADEAARMQEILGAHQDAFVAEGTLNRLSADLALGPDVVAAVKQLTAALAADRARIRSDFLRAYGEPPTGDAGRGGAW